MPDDLVLLGVASDGSTDQWDGLKTPKGILLRWLQKPGLGFPDYGYDIWRALPADHTVYKDGRIEWQAVAGKKKSDQVDEHGNQVIVESTMTMSVVSGLLRVRPQEKVTLTFPDPAYYLEVLPVSGGPVRMELFAGGKSRGVSFLSGPPILRMRNHGIERIELSVQGPGGGVNNINFRLVHDSQREWEKIAHVCLPVSHASYPCGTFTGSAENEAKKRVPPAVAAQWSTRYSAAFNDIYPYLEKLATGQVATLPPSSNPTLTFDPQTAIMLAALDPHVARIVGLGWDDTSIAMNGKEWAYKITGKWGRPRFDVVLDSQATWESIAEEIAIGTSGGKLEIVGGGVLMKSDESYRSNLLFHPRPFDDLSLTVEHMPGQPTGIAWRALSSSGAVLTQGTQEKIPGGGLRSVIQINAKGIKKVEFWSSHVDHVSFLLRRITVAGAGTLIERGAILPSIFATETGPPEGPGWIAARPEQPGGTTAEQPSAGAGTGSLQAALEWELHATEDGLYEEGAPVLHQVAGHQLSSDPSAPKPAGVPFQTAYLLKLGLPILVPSQTAAVTDPRRRFYTDRGLSEGWREWWARGVDLFGRVSAVSPGVIEKLQDDALPPSPDVLFAEYVQANLALHDAALLGRSPLARQWLTANPQLNAVAVVFGWSPERVKQAPDVDGFRVYVRRPAAVTNPGPTDPEERYEGVAWGAARSEIGPIPMLFGGTVSSVTAGVPSVTVTGVAVVDPTHATCTTDVALDWGGGALIGGQLVAGSSSYPIVGNGEGSGVGITVQHPAGAPPAAGSFQLLAGTSEIVSVVTNISAPALTGTAIRRRMSGVLAGKGFRLMVLGRTGGTFICRRLGTTSLPGTPPFPVAWYPAYAVVIHDTGFGPNASATHPVANAQVTVRSVRRLTTRPIESPDAKPGQLTAVDATPPTPPVGFDFIPSGLRCAEVATRADWYGTSRVTLTWQSSPTLDYVIYRALGDAVFQLDRQAHASVPHTIPQSKWPADLWANVSRRTAVQNDLAALDAALSGGDNATIQAAYEGLRAGTQQLIAGQTAVDDAFVALHEAPIQASSYTDELDGRSRAHWFYRFAARSRSGMESAMSASTPPICCPDVVPPQPPLGQLALARAGAVRLEWQISPEPDLAHYQVYRTGDEVSSGDVRDMKLVATVAPSPTSTLATGEVLPASVANLPWLQYDDPAQGGRDWIYRIVAVDTAGNASQPSGVLRGRALVPPPVPPVWSTPARGQNEVKLTWTHPDDQRLACLVERRVPGGIWTSIAEWLPRGVYSFRDEPPDLAAAWEYRLSVRDHLGQIASSMPVVVLPAEI